MNTPQSLPSFAQAFNTPSLNSISAGNNSLPPIQSRTPTLDHSPANVRKRSRTDLAAAAARDGDDSDSGRQSPRLIRIKEEHDQDMLDASPQPMDLQDTAGAPAPSSLRPSFLKKRRVTISGSGAPHPLNTDVRIPPSEQPSSTPISPVVIGFTIQRDDPAALEQVRSMLTVKQKQKALIEQRRGSTAGIISTTSGPSANPNTDERSIAVTAIPSSRTARRSPIPTSNVNNGRRGGSTTQPPPPPSSPGPIIVPSQPLPVKSSLPAPPISFARRRAGQLGGTKKKPADIVISPREAHTQEQLQPAIQSAPPIPQAGNSQRGFYTGRFPMTLPRLPSVMGSGEGTVRRTVAGQVPPTPSRLAMLQQQQQQRHATAAHPSFSGRSPPASVAIATTLVPPTPASLHHPGYSGDKSAFLGLFSNFYDSLNDSKTLKNWLGEQLQKSSQLVQTLTQQRDKLDEAVDALVERKLGEMRDEMTGLHRRVEELEDALRVTRAELVHRRQSEDSYSGFHVPTAKIPVRNGSMHTSSSQEPYTFPPVPLVDRRFEPIGKKKTSFERTDKDHNLPRSENSSPIPYNSRRLSVSATRLELPSVAAMQSPPLGTGRVRHSSPSNARTTSASVNSTPVLAAKMSGHRASSPPHRQVSNTRVQGRSSPSVVDRPGTPMDDDDDS